MLYFQAADPIYYSNKSYQKLCKAYNVKYIFPVCSTADFENILKLFYSFQVINEDDNEDNNLLETDEILSSNANRTIKKNDNTKSENKDNKNLIRVIDDIFIHKKYTKSVAVISPFSADFLKKDISKSNVVNIIFLKNQFGLLTSAEKERGIKVEDILSNKLSTNITSPKVNLSNYGGAELLTEIVKFIPIKDLVGMAIRGFFLTGFPGTGKSFFAKCVAGELKRYLIELNLVKFMQQSNTLDLLESFFDFFNENTGDYIIWIDEIEKMLTTDESIQVLGFLLTKINDMHDKSKSNVFLIATANDPSIIADRNPELFRNGRFDWLVALQPPIKENAKIIANIYLMQSRDSFLKHVFNLIYTYMYEPENICVLDKAEEDSAIAKTKDIIESNLESLKAFAVEHAATYKDKRALFVSDVPKLEKKYIIESILININKKCKFNFDIEEFLHKSHVFENRRDHCDIKDRFPYVPAEIEFFVSELYSRFMFINVKINTDTIVEVLENVVPLQLSMKKAIITMKKATETFLSV